jgi:hypothetical protein
MIRLFLILATVLVLTPFDALSRGGSRPVPVETKTPLKTCVEPEKKLLLFGPETSPDFLPGGRDELLAKKSFCLVNTVYANGCLERKVMAYRFSTLESDTKKQIKVTDNAEFWKVRTKNAPFKISPRKYYTRTKILGYTYFDRDNDFDLGPETRVWSNFRRYWTPEEYAAHLVHENTHQRLAGAFGHWSRFSGSAPYAMGDLAAECIAEL